jgi:hypothetical protein
MVGEAVRLADRGAGAGGRRRGVQALHPERPDRLDLRPQQHALRHVVHDVRRLRALAECACEGRLPLRLDAAADPGGSRPRALHPLLPSRHRRAGLCRLRLRRAVLADQRALERHRRRPAGLPLQVLHPDRGRAGAAAGLRRDRAVRRLPQDRGLAGAAQGRRGDGRDRDPARPERVRRRGGAPHRRARPRHPGGDGGGHAPARDGDRR